MSRGGSVGRRVVIVAAVSLMVVSLVGFIVSMMANSFVLDQYDAYGDVPIPGEQTLHLPAGKVNISFHTQIIGSMRGGSLPIPELDLTMVPPPGVADPPVTESFGGTTTVNGDAHRRVWVTDIAVAGDYRIKTDGKVSAFVSPRLAFGHSRTLGALPWVFAGLFVVGLAGQLAATFGGRWRRKAVARGSGSSAFAGDPELSALESQLSAFTGDSGMSARGIGGSSPPSHPYEPTDEGVKIRQLETLASLHSSGALTDEEFQAEKRRLLGD
jgi:Short C-terminal domain